MNPQILLSATLVVVTLSVMTPQSAGIIAEFDEWGNIIRSPWKGKRFSSGQSQFLPDWGPVWKGRGKRFSSGQGERIPVSALTPCQLAAQKKAPPGAYVPQCDDAGNYKPLQMNPSTGYRWCVDKDGVEIAGTRVSPIEPDPSCGVLGKLKGDDNDGIAERGEIFDKFKEGLGGVIQAVANTLLKDKNKDKVADKRSYDGAVKDIVKAIVAGAVDNSQKENGKQSWTKEPFSWTKKANSG
jgi:hypothetical protein